MGAGTFQALLDELATVADNKERGEWFELAVRGWLRTDRSTGQWVSVELWNDSFRADGADIGVDLIAEDPTGALTAVQAKLHTAPIRKRDIDSFLSASTDGTYARRLLVATTPPAPNARRVLRDQQVPVDVVGLDQLHAAPVAWPTLAELLANATPTPVARFTPRPHQERALNDLMPYVSTEGRAQVHMACGTGKSLTALWAAEESGATTVLVLAPALALVKQLISEWAVHTSWENWAILPVCSAGDVKAAGSGTEDKPEAADRAAPEELPVGATTDATEIAVWLDTHPAKVKVIVGTYQSSARIAEALTVSSLDRFDLAVCDEAHRLGGRPAPDYSCVLRDDALPVATRLFFTATPRILAPAVQTRARKGGEDLKLLTSMDDPAVFGPVAHRLPFRAAVEDGLLCGYQVVVVGVRPGTWTTEELADKRVLIGSDRLDANFVARVEAVRAAMADHDLSRVIAYWTRVATAKAATALLNELGPIAGMDVDAAHVTGADPVIKRSRTLAALEHDGTRRAIISNARCLTEGVDVPVVDTVVFCEPRRSLVDVVQAVGRAMRTAPGKPIGTVVVPLLVPDGGDTDTEFDTVIQVLAALAAEDKLLAQRLTALRRASARRTLTAADFASTVVFSGELIDRADIADALVAKVVSRTTSSLWEGVELLATYRAEHGDSSPAQTYTTADGFQLGSWTNKRRSDYREGRLTQELEVALDALGFVWNPLQQRQEKALAALEAFKEEHDHDPPNDYVTQGGFRLGAWCQKRRSTHREGRLTQELEVALDALGFVWDPLQAQQEKAFAALEAFSDEFGHCSPPATFVAADGFRLGAWCTNRRHELRTKGLDPELKGTLDALGFVWDPYKTGYEQGLTALALYRDELGHAAPEQAYVTADGFLLGAWCARRRQDLKSGRLDPELMVALDALGFVWEPHQAGHQKALDALTAYQQEHGHGPPEDHVTKDGFRLGTWINASRQNFRNGKLDPELMVALDALGFVWEPRQAGHQEGLDAFAAYQQEHGHGPPRDYVTKDGFGLGGWCQRRRADRRRDRLAPDIEAALDALGFVWEPLRARQETALATLAAYRAEQGDPSPRATYVTPDGFRLGNWCSSRRQERRRGQLDPQLEAALDALGFVWDLREG